MSFACSFAMYMARVLGHLQPGSCKMMDEDTARLLQIGALHMPKVGAALETGVWKV